MGVYIGIGDVYNGLYIGVGINRVVYRGMYFGGWILIAYIMKL